MQIWPKPDAPGLVRNGGRLGKPIRALISPPPATPARWDASLSCRMVLVAFTIVCIRAGVFAGIQVAVEAREVAAADFKPNPVAFQKHVARGPQIDFVLVDLAGHDGLGRRSSWTRDNGRAECLPSDCAQSRRAHTSTSLAVKSVSTAEDLAKRSSVTGPVTSSVFIERRRGVDEHIGAGFHFLLVARAGGR